MERGRRNGTSFKQTKSAGAIRRRAKECEGLAGGDGAPGARSPVMGAGGKLIIPGPPKLRLGPSSAEGGKSCEMRYHSGSWH